MEKQQINFREKMEQAEDASWPAKTKEEQLFQYTCADFMTLLNRNFPNYGAIIAISMDIQEEENITEVYAIGSMKGRDVVEVIKNLFKSLPVKHKMLLMLELLSIAEKEQGGNYAI